MGLGLGVGGGAGGSGGLGGPSTSSQQVAGNLSSSRDDADGLTIGQQMGTNGQQQSTNNAEEADEITSVPEPTSVVLLGAGLLLLVLQAKWHFRRRRLEQTANRDL